MLEVTVDGQWAAVALAGEFDVANASGLPLVVADLVAQGVTDLAFDLSEVTFMDCTGAEAMAEAAGRQPSGRVVLLGVSGPLRLLLGWTGLDRGLRIFDHPSAPGGVTAPLGVDDGHRLTLRLRALAKRTVSTLADCTAASVAVLVGGQSYTAVVSGPLAMEVDAQQYLVDQGPCLLAVETGRRVRIDVLADDVDFPSFAPLAVGSGVMSVLSSPVHDHRGRMIGSLNLYSDLERGFDRKAEDAGAGLAGCAARVLTKAGTGGET